MIVVDTSVLVAILLEEPDAGMFVRYLADHGNEFGVPTPALTEAHMVLSRNLTDPSAALDALLGDLVVTPLDFTAAHAAEARSGFQRFGKGRHAAGLNFGDCLVYGAAKSLGAPLLFKGNDFALTDIVPAL